MIWEDWCEGVRRTGSEAGSREVEISHGVPPGNGGESNPSSPRSVDNHLRVDDRESLGAKELVCTKVHSTRRELNIVDAGQYIDV